MRGFRTKLTIDQAAEALYTLMGKDDKSRWLSQLSAVPTLDLVRAQDELLFLDFFAIYFSLKFTRSANWPDHAKSVFEKFFTLFVGWLETFWASKNAGTTADAFTVLDGRLRTYGARIEEPSSADPDTMLRSMGETFAMYALVDETFFDQDGHPREDRFPDVVRKLAQDVDEITITIGAQAFNYRIQSLCDFFDSNKLK